MTAADRAAKGARLVSDVSLLAIPGLIGTNRMKAWAVAQGIHAVANRAETRLREYDTRRVAAQRKANRQRGRQRDPNQRKDRQRTEAQRRSRSRRTR